MAAPEDARLASDWSCGSGTVGLYCTVCTFLWEGELRKLLSESEGETHLTSKSREWLGLRATGARGLDEGEEEGEELGEVEEELFSILLNLTG